MRFEDFLIIALTFFILGGFISFIIFTKVGYPLQKDEIVNILGQKHRIISVTNNDNGFLITSYKIN